MKNMPPRNNLRSAGQGRALREKQRSKETVTNPLSTSYFPEKIIKTQKTKRKTYTSATLVSKSKKPAIPKFKSKSKKRNPGASGSAWPRNSNMIRMMIEIFWHHPNEAHRIANDVRLESGADVQLEIG